jgi:hypothetical protein
MFFRIAIRIIGTILLLGALSLLLFPDKKEEKVQKYEKRPGKVILFDWERNDFIYESDTLFMKPDPENRNHFISK